MKKRKRGFTLIELLVTLAVMSILMSVAVISYSYVERHNNDKAAVILGQAMFDVARDWCERSELVDDINIEKELEASFNVPVQVVKKDDKSVVIKYLYMNISYSLEGQLLTDNICIMNLKSGEKIYES